MSTYPTALRPSVFAATLLLALPAVSPAADPFYELRLQEGVRAYAVGGYATAIRDLRIACFGFLDEPESLAKGLTYLALAQAGAGDREAFSVTFLRILDVEQRFQAYSKAELASDVRRAFEARLELWEPYEALRSTPAFAPVARRILEARIVALPPPDRRQELERRLAVEPRDAVWRLLMAELELADGNFEAAEMAAELVLGQAPRGSFLSRTLCVRGRARAALGHCAGALEDLPACATTSFGADVSETKLQCYAQLGDWKRGLVLLSELPAERRRRPAVRKLAKLFEQARRQEVREMKRSPAPATAAVAETEPPPPAESTAADSTAADSTAAVSRQLTADVEEARRLLHSSDSREELTAVGERMRAEAERHPERRDLQVLVAELSYRLRRWGDTLDYFDRGGGPAPGRPDQRFYLAVALYETGDRAAAAQALELCLPHLEPSEFVRGYVARIRGEEG